MRRTTSAWLVMLMACEPITNPPAPPPPPPTPAPVKPAIAPVAPAPVAPTATVNDAEPARELRSGLFAQPDGAPGHRTIRKTAVLLIVPARNAWHDDEQFDAESPAGPQRFIPIACAIDGVLVTGEKCGELMPARTTIRVSSGELAVARSTTPYRDVRGDTTPAPYGPACCNYNACRGKTIAYSPARSTTPPPERTTFGVWPADADISLSVAVPGLGGIATSDLPQVSTGQVTQAFQRGTRRYASTVPASGGPILWDLGQGWVNADAPKFGHSDALLATADLAHDGHLVLIGYEVWANDYGIDVFSDGVATPSYTFSCGNI